MFSLWLAICFSTGCSIDLLVPRPSTGDQLSSMIGALRLPASRIMNSTSHSFIPFKFFWGDNISAEKILQLKFFVPHHHEALWALLLPAGLAIECQRSHGWDIMLETLTNMSQVLVLKMSYPSPEESNLSTSIGSALQPYP